MDLALIPLVEPWSEDADGAKVWEGEALVKDGNWDDDGGMLYDACVIESLGEEPREEWPALTCADRTDDPGNDEMLRAGFWTAVVVWLW